MLKRYVYIYVCVLYISQIRSILIVVAQIHCIFIFICILTDLHLKSLLIIFGSPWKCFFTAEFPHGILFWTALNTPLHLRGTTHSANLSALYQLLRIVHKLELPKLPKEGREKQRNRRLLLIWPILKSFPSWLSLFLWPKLTSRNGKNTASELNSLSHFIHHPLFLTCGSPACGFLVSSLRGRVFFPHSPWNQGRQHQDHPLRKPF